MHDTQINAYRMNISQIDIKIRFGLNNIIFGFESEFSDLACITAPPQKETGTQSTILPNQWSYILKIFLYFGCTMQHMGS